MFPSRVTPMGEYEPQLIKKYQNTVTQDMEEKILSMYAKGMTTSDIESHMKEPLNLKVNTTHGIMGKYP